MKVDSEKIKESVRKSYTGVAKNVNISSCCGHTESPSSCGSDSSNSCCGTDETAVTTLKKLGYELEDLKNIPEESMLGAGCGNPTAMAALKTGEVVLDLGSGAGIDCFLAANKVGDEGYVIGVDFTLAMLARARLNAVKGGYENVEFRKGDIENLPIVDNSVDVIISNCVINLAPDKEKVFSEAFRVLKPGGRIHVSDIVWLKDLPESIRNDEEALAGCVGGAVRKDQYIDAIEKAGFTDIAIEKEIKVPVVVNEKSLEKTGERTVAVITGREATDLEDSIASIDVSAFKPE